MNVPRVKVFVNRGEVEAVWSDAQTLDVEIIEVTDAQCYRAFDHEYAKAEREGMTEVRTELNHISTPDGEEDYDDDFEPSDDTLEMGFDPYAGTYTFDC